MATLEAPFPYFGGKSSVAAEVWKRLGHKSKTYIEPFAGSAAMLLGRPHWKPGLGYAEIINDADGMVSNFWRAIQSAPDKVAKYADWPVIENDFHARHAWLTERHESICSKLEGDPNWFDAKIAGWWSWIMACKLGGGVCTGNGPWVRREIEGQTHLVKLNRSEKNETRRGISRSTPIRWPQGVVGKDSYKDGHLAKWFQFLSNRLRQVWIYCGDWSRICSNVFTDGSQGGVTIVFLDPPYGGDPDDLCHSIYRKDSLTVSADTCKWALEHGDNPKMRIALCGYEGEHKIPKDWVCWEWRAQGGYGNGADVEKATNWKGKRPERNKNRHRERIWFSPHCRKPVDSSIGFFK